MEGGWPEQLASQQGGRQPCPSLISGVSKSSQRRPPWNYLRYPDKVGGFASLVHPPPSIPLVQLSSLYNLDSENDGATSREH